MAAGIMVTGALGQIGTELVLALRERHGADAVLATDIREDASQAASTGPYATLSVLDREAMGKLVEEHDIGVIYHLAAILSATGESKPDLCRKVNIEGTKNVLEVAREFGCRVYAPSSIAVFGPDCPNFASQDAALNPTTVYGETKVIGEELASQYWSEHRVDVRGLRYPGLVSYKAPAGGGTTDYAVEIFHAALNGGHYQCFVSEDTRLPMMYMDDAIRATLSLMDAPAQDLGGSRGGYNIAGASFTAGELVAAIQAKLPDFTCDFVPDVRQTYADTWPDAVDDSVARAEWGWAAEYDLERMVEAMFAGLSN